MAHCLYTIGFTRKSAEEFFHILKHNKIELVADVRLNNRGQLAGFTKEKDFIFFLSLFNIDYLHLKSFAPVKEIRKEYHKSGNFDRYTDNYFALLESRKAVQNTDPTLFLSRRVCLLCSEPLADRCHRRLAAETIAASLNNMAIVHL